MLHGHLPVLLVVLLSSVLLVRVSSAPHRDMVTELLKSDLMKDEDLDLLLFLKLVPEVVAAGENEVLPELEEESGVREEVVRRHLPQSHRERKAGCRNFFWKTFTSC